MALKLSALGGAGLALLASSRRGREASDKGKTSTACDKGKESAGISSISISSSSQHHEIICGETEQTCKVQGSPDIASWSRPMTLGELLHSCGAAGDFSLQDFSSSSVP